MESKYGQIYTEDELRSVAEGIHDEDVEDLHDRGITFPKEEPVFVLRAKDANAIRAIAAYRQFCAETGSPVEHINSIDEVLRQFQFFQEQYPDRVKIPD